MQLAEGGELGLEAKEARSPAVASSGLGELRGDSRDVVGSGDGGARCDPRAARVGIGDRGLVAAPPQLEAMLEGLKGDRRAAVMTKQREERLAVFAHSMP